MLAAGVIARPAPPATNRSSGHAENFTPIVALVEALGVDAPWARATLSRAQLDEMVAELGQVYFFDTSERKPRTPSKPRDEREDFFRRSAKALGSAPASGEPTVLQRIRKAQQAAENPFDRLRRRLLNKFEHRVIDQWVDRTLIAMEARRQGYTVTDEEVARELIPLAQKSLKQRLAPGPEPLTITNQSATGEEQKSQALLFIVEGADGKIQDPGVRETVMDEVRRWLERHGLNSKRFFRELKDNILANKLIRDTVYKYYTEDDLRNYHARFTDRFHQPARYKFQSLKYLFRPGDTKQDVARWRKVFRSVAAQARRGKDLYELAIRRKDLPKFSYVSTSSFMTKIEMPQVMQKVVDSLRVGETSGLLEDERGFYIVKLVDVIPPVGDDFEQVRGRVEEEFFDAVKSQLLEALHQRYRIVINRRGIRPEILQKD